MTGLAVVGFHRSGTSAAMQHLEKAGMHIGSDLVGATDQNPYGHFEDWAAVRFHESLLAEAGLDWASVVRGELPTTPASDASMRAYYESHEALGEPWGFKDPRICQYISKWLETCPNLLSLAVFRSPAECVWSLLRRNLHDMALGQGNEAARKKFDDDPDHGLRLWITHNQKILDATEAYAERSLVVGHAAFAAGFSLAEALNKAFGFGLRQTDVADTFDANAVTRQVSPLPVRDKSLADEAYGIWQKLNELDASKAETSATKAQLFVHDPNGTILKDACLDMQLSAIRKLGGQLQEALVAKAQLAYYISELAATRNELEKTRHSAQLIARKLKKFPFSVYFNRSKRYKALVDELSL